MAELEFESPPGAPVVLIVDDDDVVRDVGEHYLTELGLAVRHADSGETALDLVAREVPDAILMDVSMGGIDGYETTAALRRLPGLELVPILFLTASDDVDSINRAYEVGATDFAVKPGNWTIIGHRLRYLLRVVELTDQQKRLVAEVQRSQKMEAVATLASGIAHDFNNVLQTIRGTAELVQLEMPADTAGYRDMEGILSAVDSGSRLIRQLLASGRRREIERRRIDLNEHVRSVAALLQRALPSNVRIETHLSEGALDVNADPVQIEQVLMNLAINARDAMPGGGVIRFRTDNECGNARIAVEDTGHGIEPAVVDRVFEPFFSTKSDDQGTGLGLSMVRDIVAGCDGRVSCKSEPGTGTTFEILLPLLSEPALALSAG